MLLGTAAVPGFLFVLDCSCRSAEYGETSGELMITVYVSIRKPRSTIAIRSIVVIEVLFFLNVGKYLVIYKFRDLVHDFGLGRRVAKRDPRLGRG